MREQRRRGGCFLESVIVPIIFIVFAGVMAFHLTDTPGPRVNLDALSFPSSQPAPRALGVGSVQASEPAGSLAAYTTGVRNWEEEILGWEKRYNVDRHIIATIMQIESCGNPGLTSKVGAKGLFQVMPIHFSEHENPLDPDTNAMRAMKFFLEMHEYTGYDVYVTFAGYNGGFRAAKSSYQSWPIETQVYYTLARGIYDDVKAGLNPSPTIQAGIVEAGRCPP